MRVNPIVLRISLVIGAVILSLGITGCPYSFKSSGGTLVKSIAVEQIENKTMQAGVSDILTELVVDALIRDGRIEVLGQSDAEAILEGSLSSYSRDAFEYDISDQVSRYAVSLTVEMRLIKRESGEEIWKTTFSEQGIYSATDQTEEDGQADAASKLVVAIMNKTTRSW